MLRITIIALTLALASLTACKDPCTLPAKPVVQERPEGLGDPLVCNEAGTSKCCSWQWDGCLHTFCNVSIECGWEYKSGIRVDGTQLECPVPSGYVQVIVDRPDYLP